MFKGFEKSIKSHHVLLFLGALVLVYVIYNYSSGKSMFPENYANSNAGSMMKKNNSQPMNSQPTGANENTFAVDYASISAPGSAGGNAMTGIPANCSGKPTANPSDLLPRDNNSSWSMNPQGSGDFMGVNFLNAGYMIGTDTVGSSLRNANLQVRSEPPNPQISVGPWNNSTIEGDPFRRPLEIGCGSQ